jgi:hypothetical protein
MLRKNQHERATITDLIEDEWLNDSGLDPLDLYFNEIDYEKIQVS